MLHIRGGTDYADAIGILLRQLGPSGPFWRYAKEPSDYKTPPLSFPPNTDWLAEARSMAVAMDKRLIQTKTGTWVVVDPDEWNPRVDEERDLLLELAFQMRELEPDTLLGRMSRMQWDEWQDWLRKRRAA
jgi:hypothetical protein